MRKLLPLLFALPLTAQTSQVLTGKAAFTDFSKEKPGIRRHITLADIPDPHPEESFDNGPTIVPRPDGAWPIAPAGFKVTLFAGSDSTFKQPRLIRTAPNGDLFLADSEAGTIYVLRGLGPDGRAAHIEAFATGLDHPFGIAFYPLGPDPKYVYIGNTTSVVRFSYHRGDMKAAAAAETIVPVLPGYAQLRGGGHWTRDIAFTLDGKRMLVSVGSASNVDDADTHPREEHRADVLQFTPEGQFVKVFAAGLRNCVGEAINPITGALWCSTNERDGLGDNLVPDYITSVPEDSFFGWPWYYMGQKKDPRLPDSHPDLRARTRTPDVILNPHFASLEMLFYPNTKSGTGTKPGAPHLEEMGALQNRFPAPFAGDGFAAEHGSWNRTQRAGYEVIRIPMHNGIATGEYEDFLTGFTLPDGKVWGRPVGVAVANDGSLFVTDDASKSVWRVTYTGK